MQQIWPCGRRLRKTCTEKRRRMKTKGKIFILRIRKREEKDKLYKELPRLGSYDRPSSEGTGHIEVDDTVLLIL